METDAPAVSSRRPRWWLLAALGIAIVWFVAARMWPDSSASVAPPPSNQTRTPAAAREEAVDPDDLQVKLEALEAERPDPGGVSRNPFRFQPRAAPAPRTPTAGSELPPVMTMPSGPPPPPEIPLKFMGIVEVPGVGKVAALTDCRFTYKGQEGEIIDGRYRLVKIGVESIVIERVDGSGRTTIRLSGDCPPR